MAELLFDTMAAVRRLRDTGMEERQAEAVTETVRDGLTGGVATKPDMSELKAEFKDGMAEMKVELRSDRARQERDLMWIKGIGGAILAFLILPRLAELLSVTMLGAK